MVAHLYNGITAQYEKGKKALLTHGKAWLNLKIGMLCERCIPIIENSRKCKLIYSDRKQTTGCLERERERERRRRVYKRTQTLGSYEYFHHRDCGDHFTGVMS